jgi:hypothetical protein
MNRNRLQGITLIGFALILLVGGFFAYAAMRLIPAYTEYMGVLKAVNQLRTEPGIATKSLDEIRRNLQFKFSTQYVDDANVPITAITLKHEAGAATLRVNYERRLPFMYNVELLVTFDKSVNLASAAD